MSTFNDKLEAGRVVNELWEDLPAALDALTPFADEFVRTLTVEHLDCIAIGAIPRIVQEKAAVGSWLVATERMTDEQRAALIRHGLVYATLAIGIQRITGEDPMMLSARHLAMLLRSHRAESH